MITKIKETIKTGQIELYTHMEGNPTTEYKMRFVSSDGKKTEYLYFFAPSSLNLNSIDDETLTAFYKKEINTVFKEDHVSDLMVFLEDYDDYESGNLRSNRISDYIPQGTSESPASVDTIYEKEPEQEQAKAYRSDSGRPRHRNVEPEPEPNPS